MRSRWGRAVMAFGLVLASTLTSTVVAVGPAHALNSNQINKLKSIWGGGWVLNVGQSEGALTHGHPAQLWFNVNHDWNNRWVVREGQTDGWWVYQNLYSGKCLTAVNTVSGAKVVQHTCDSNAPSQRWRMAGDLGWNNHHMPLRNKWVDSVNPSANLVLTQQSKTVGAAIIMSWWIGSDTQWWRSHRCGDYWSDGSITTPAGC
jgi:hypothetical protein